MITPEQIDARLREIGIPPETMPRDGGEPSHLHVKVNGRAANWYATSPIGVIMLKSDIAVMLEQWPTATFTIEAGRP